MEFFELRFIVITVVSILVLRFILSSFTTKGIVKRTGGIPFALLSLVIGWGLAYVATEFLRIPLEFSFIYAVAIAGGEAMLENMLKPFAETGQVKPNKHPNYHKNHSTQAYPYGQEGRALGNSAQYEKEPFIHGLMKQKNFGERGPVKKQDSPTD